MKNVPLLVFANKQDLVGSMSGVCVCVCVFTAVSCCHVGFRTHTLGHAPGRCNPQRAHVCVCVCVCVSHTQVMRSQTSST